MGPILSNYCFIHILFVIKIFDVTLIQCFQFAFYKFGGVIFFVLFYPNVLFAHSGCVRFTSFLKALELQDVSSSAVLWPGRGSMKINWCLHPFCRNVLLKGLQRPVSFHCWCSLLKTEQRFLFPGFVGHCSPEWIRTLGVFSWENKINGPLFLGSSKPTITAQWSSTQPEEGDTADKHPFISSSFSSSDVIYYRRGGNPDWCLAPENNRTLSFLFLSLGETGVHTQRMFGGGKGWWWWW